MPDFKLAKIYKIIPLNPEHESDVYIGSTCKPRLSQRLTKHIYDYNYWKNGKYNKVSSFKLFDKYGIENLNIYLIEEFPCETKDQLRKKEGYYIKNIPCVNKYLPGRTVKESQKQYRDNHKDYFERYRDNNKDHIKEYRDNHKEYFQTKFNCICGGCYTRNHKSTHYKSLKHINYMTKHDDIMNKVNDLIISIKQLKPICSINYLNI